MDIQPVQLISFGYSNQLKTLFKKGKLPTVKYDISGRRLTKKNVTLDHVIPKSKGGTNTQDNYMLATEEFNHLRGNKPLDNFMTKRNLIRYLSQFMDIFVDGFDGNKYVKGLLKTLDRANELGV